MGTRSTVALEFADASVSQVYCHWDGYLENNGRILEQYYSDPYKVRELLDLGDMSSLRPNITAPAGVEHTFESSDEDTTVFYMRDRGETGCEARRYKDVTEYFAECQQEEYDYLLRNVDGKATWFVRCYATDGAWTTIPEAYALQEQMNKEGVY